MTLRTVIADDEPVARRVLREELELLPDLSVVGEAEDGAKALELIATQSPDLVFLDLQMPSLSGLEVVRRLSSGSQWPVIVIVTAYDQYAIQAFEAGAVDYLLKPVSQERVAQAVERARRLVRQTAQVAESIARIHEVAEQPGVNRSRKIVGKSGEEYVLLNTDEVLAFQAENDVVWIVTAKRRFLATQTLRTLEEKLRNTSFRRIHRNALVNLDHVRKMSALSSQRWLVTLNNQMEFIVSKRQASAVRELLSW